MIRRTPAGKQAARFLPIVAGLVALGFVTKACTSDEPTEVPTDITVQAGNHQGGGGAAASCTAPCVEVQVVERGNNPPEVDGAVPSMVVTLLNGGNDPSDPGVGIVGIQEIDQNGIATFLFDQAPDNIQLEAGGYCAYVTSVTNAEVQEGAADDGTIPAENLSRTNPLQRVVAAPFLGSVSESPTRSSTLSRSTYLSNCVNWTRAANAPFFVDASTALSVKLKVAGARASETVQATCRYFDGGDAPEGVVVADNKGFCPSWGVISLENVALPIWFSGGPTALGVKRGLLISAANTNPARLYVPSGQGIALEAATTGADIQETTFSTLAAGGDNVTANVDPTVCFVNERAVSGTAACGVEFLDMQDGYIGLSALNEAGFGFDDEHVAIWYDYKKVGGNHTVTMKGRLQKNPDCKDPGNTGRCADNLPNSANFQISADFGVGCQPNDQPITSGQVPDGDFTVQCRQEGNNFRATWVLMIPPSRVLEYRLEAACGSSPPPSRQGTSGDARWLVNFPTEDNGQLDGDNQCLLPESTIGDDSKWWIGPGS